MFRETEKRHGSSRYIRCENRALIKGGHPWGMLHSLKAGFKKNNRIIDESPIGQDTSPGQLSSRATDSSSIKSYRDRSEPSHGCGHLSAVTIRISGTFGDRGFFSSLSSGEFVICCTHEASRNPRIRFFNRVETRFAIVRVSPGEGLIVHGCTSGNV